ncbi:site-specific integrase [Streptomyces sp. SID3343]|uniref:site-specific integrase n=1 Tax=Streptomyces sp. SID3343 TaxID=2690260 RepID=UPI001370323E|nr:site-specific integrase [Streptomyces sp. SID3343]MYW06002.1 tyrosine-type recombinase/integrase [Streptomyces sp. SID3343]
MAVDKRAPALDQLDRALLRVTARADTSPARARQLRWVVGELRRALAQENFPVEARASLARLLSAAPITRYLQLAESGRLRSRAVAGSGTSTAASMRVRMDCLEILARAGSVPVELPQRPAMPDLKTPVGARQRSLLHHWLAENADRPGADAGRIRLFALVGVVLETGARAGELCALRLSDLGPDDETVRIVRRPQARSVNPAVVEVLPLSGPTRAALRRWLDVREELVRHVQGTATAVWVSVRGNHAGVLDAAGGSRRRPTGMPLMPRGLSRAYTRTVVQLNSDMIGRPGWEPLPYRLEQLRRAVELPPPADRAASSSAPGPGLASGVGRGTVLVPGRRRSARARSE